MTITELFDFVGEKATKVQESVEARKQSEETWRHGTDASWKRAKCKMNKAMRLEVADREARILVKLNHELEAYKALLCILHEMVEKEL